MRRLLLKSLDQKSKFLQMLILLSPTIICLILMLPRLLSPQFGLFDDASTIMTLRNLKAGTTNLVNEISGGRFRPFYWIYYYFIFSFFGERPFWFFLGNAILFGGSTVFIILFTKRMGASKFQAWTAGLLFALTGPAIENIYTLSKGEVLQSFWISLTMLLASKFQTKERLSDSWKLMLLVMVPVFFAFGSKETSIVMLPISGAWFFLAYIRKRLNPTSDQQGYRIRKFFFIAVLLVTVVFLAWVLLIRPVGIDEQNYAKRYTINLDRIISSSRVWLDWISRDFLYMLFLAFIPIIQLLRTHKIENVSLILDMLIWTMAWIAIFLSWEFQAGYYLLPFTIGLSILGGLFFGYIFAPKLRMNKPLVFLSHAMTVIGIILLLFTIPNNITEAKHQLMVDKTNDEMINNLVAYLPKESHLIINIQYANEYVWNIRKYLNSVYGRRDIIVDHFQFQNFEEIEPPRSFVYILSPHIINQYYPSIRLGVFEEYMRDWNPAMLDYIGDDYDIVFETEGSIQLILIDSLRIFCPLVRKKLSYCRVPNTPFDLQTLSYGWTLYRVPVFHSP